MKKILLIPFLFSFVSLFGQQTISYQVSEENFANPERGLYHYTETRFNGYNNLNENTIKGWLENEKISLVHRMFYLDKDAPISQEYLDAMQLDFDRIRSAGLKCIPRFAYTKTFVNGEFNPPYNDATVSTVLMHVNQLKPILHKNADVISSLQAGFIGTWGEWYYSDHFTTTGNMSNPSDEDWNNRKLFLEELMKALPSERMIEVRYPRAKIIMTGSNEPLTEAEAHSGTFKSRLSHHNDCFVSSANDVGTYRDAATEKPYLEKDTQFLVMGGETCAVFEPYSDCPNSLNELERFHWSYLNIDYNRSVYNGWKDQGCYDEVVRKLGYRFELISSTVTNASKPGGGMNVEVKLINNGYAAPYNPRIVELVLRNSDDSEEYTYEIPVDPRFWLPGETITLNVDAGLAGDFVEGEYDVFLNFPDPKEQLRNKAPYSIRTANEGLWEQSSGYNRLNQSVSVSSANDVDSYSGSEYFKSADTGTPSAPTSLGNILKLRSSGNQITSYWPLLENAVGYKILRAEEGGEMNWIGTADVNEFIYVDQYLKFSASYSYQLEVEFADGSKGLTEPVIISTHDANIEYPLVFEIDGMDNDWQSVLPKATADNNSSHSISVINTIENLYFLIEGEGLNNNYTIYLDSDNDATTGYSDIAWASTGFDFKIENGSLFKYDKSTDSWNLVVETSHSYNQNFIEVALPLEVISAIGPEILVGFISNGEILPLHEPLISMYIVPAPLTPQNFLVVNSKVESRRWIDLTWDLSDFVQGYIVERSLDGELFEVIDTVTIHGKYIDKGLNPGTTYYFRVRAYNQLGVSSYTETLQISTTGTPIVSGINDGFSAKNLAFYPNPTKGKFTINLSLTKAAQVEISVFDLAGNKLLKETKHFSTGEHEVHLNMNDLNASKGLLILQLLDIQNAALKSFKIIYQ